ncbi:hypothetical protein HU762_17635 [Pseudomonas sp. SWRI92]|uniref:hypothetical protein n=1 Tax=Pseudomonas sp. SWRI92 TaxID=2745499 RepID=UPI001647554B|nr:hypothetical protein [Pseudomonas sp. SWRI92]MBC3375775.1 hypothetical protein [Pseudomonas sp. SWRI92]
MTIDKQKLQKLLWAEAASYRADCADWKRNTEALQEFLGEKTMEEVALLLLAENDWLARGGHLLIPDRDEHGTELERLKADNEALRSDIETWKLSVQAERNCHRSEKEGLQQELDRLKGPAFAEELAALRKDAGRWRFFSVLANDLQAFPRSWGQMTPEKIDFMCDEPMAGAAIGKGEQS